METLFDSSVARTVAIHLSSDPRFSYSLMTPLEMDENTRLLVSVHGSDRDPRAAMESYRELVLWHNVAVLAPLFPRFVDDTGDLLGYKLVRWGGINYDDVLFNMIAEAHEHFGTPTGPFMMSGYSGGGQFVHRFALFHAKELICVAVGAPGRVTLPTADEPWWLGLSDTEEQLGLRADLDALKATPVQVVAADLDIGEGYPVPKDSGVWFPNLELAGTTRLERSRSFYRALLDIGGDVRMTIVHNQSHEAPGALEVFKLFFAEQLRMARA